MRRSRRLRRQRRVAAILLATLALAAATIAAAAIGAHRHALGAETWRGLAVAPEHRCAHYDRADYLYSPSIEAGIVAAMGGKVPVTIRTLQRQATRALPSVLAARPAVTRQASGQAAEGSWRRAGEG